MKPRLLNPSDTDSVLNIFKETWIDTYPNHDFGITKKHIIKKYESKERYENIKNYISNFSDEKIGSVGITSGYIKYNKDTVELLKENNLLKYYIYRFENYFSSVGFEKKQGLKFVGEDDTILFTNSAIVSLKKYVLLGEKIPSYFITQPCIRLQNLNNSILEEALYMSSFHMIGAFISAEKYDNFIKQVWNFLLNEMEYNMGDLKIYCDKNHNSIINGWKKIENGPEIVYSDEGFDWKFGEGDKMRGHGFDFRVKARNGEYVDIGNIMEIISEGKVVGYGLGLGVETLISKKRGYINPIQFFTENAGIEIERNEDIYLYDSLKVLIDSYRNGLKSGKKSSGYELKKAFNKINSILSLDIGKYINIYDEIVAMEKFIYGNEEVSKNIYDELMNRSIFQVSIKPFSLLISLEESENLIIKNLSSIFPDIKFDIKDIYIGNSVGIGNKSITISMTYVSEKSKSKEYFKNILGKIGEIYKIR